jgi:flavin reductase (DIM6/NTAB) family NADH-FMN oxidoreductase RutF
MQAAPDPWTPWPQPAGPEYGSAPDDVASVDDAAFRDVMARLGGGVCLLTAVDPIGRDCGLTVTAATSLSLDPPLVLVAVRHGSFIHDALSVAEGFALTVLAVDQLPLAHYGARHRYPTDVDDFGPWKTVRADASGSLVFTGGVAAVDCLPYGFVDAGDHTIALGRAVQTVFPTTGTIPLLHVDRAYYAPGARLDVADSSQDA